MMRKHASRKHATHRRGTHGRAKVRGRRTVSSETSAQLGEIEPNRGEATS
jgi:hypothetical protein